MMIKKGNIVTIIGFVFSFVGLSFIWTHSPNALTGWQYFARNRLLYPVIVITSFALILLWAGVATRSKRSPSILDGYGIVSIGSVGLFFCSSTQINRLYPYWKNPLFIVQQIGQMARFNFGSDFLVAGWILIIIGGVISITSQVDILWRDKIITEVPLQPLSICENCRLASTVSNPVYRFGFRYGSYIGSQTFGNKVRSDYEISTDVGNAHLCCDCLEKENNRHAVWAVPLTFFGSMFLPIFAWGIWYSADLIQLPNIAEQIFVIPLLWGLNVALIQFSWKNPREIGEGLAIRLKMVGLIKQGYKTFWTATKFAEVFKSKV